jgi:hypothetical protein
MVETIITRFNQIQQTIAGTIPKVAYVDARPLLPNVLQQDAYKQWWANELHPTNQGFAAVAGAFHAAIQTFPMP